MPRAVARPATRATLSPSPPSPPVTRYVASARRAGIAPASGARRRSRATRRPSARRATWSSPSVEASSPTRAAAGSGSSGSRSMSPPQSSGCSSATTRPNPHTGACAAATDGAGLRRRLGPLVTTHRRAREAAGEAASACARCSRLPTPRICAACSDSTRAVVGVERPQVEHATRRAPSRAATTSATSRWKPSGCSGRRTHSSVTARDRRWYRPRRRRSARRARGRARPRAGRRRRGRRARASRRPRPAAGRARGSPTGSTARAPRPPRRGRRGRRRSPRPRAAPASRSGASSG